MSSRRRKQRKVPAIVPRFLKSAVTIGAIPALAACGSKRAHQQPVVAAYQGDRTPAVVAAYTQPPPPPPPADAAAAEASPPPRGDAGGPGEVERRVPPAVVAAYQSNRVPVDAGVDAKPPSKGHKVKQKKVEIPPPVVAAYVGRPDDPPPPPVVAAYVPKDKTPPSPANKPK